MAIMGSLKKWDYKQIKANYMLSTYDDLREHCRKVEGMGEAVLISGSFNRKTKGWKEEKISKNQILKFYETGDVVNNVKLDFWLNKKQITSYNKMNLMLLISKVIEKTREELEEGNMATHLALKYTDKLIMMYELLSREEKRQEELEEKESKRREELGLSGGGEKPVITVQTSIN